MLIFGQTSCERDEGRYIQEEESSWVKGEEEKSTECEESDEKAVPDETESWKREA